jgi:hypothetical protein
MTDRSHHAPQHRLDDLREWLMSQIDGSEETRGDDGLISDFIRQIDALPSEMGVMGLEPRGCPTPGSCSAVAEIADIKQRLFPQYLAVYDRLAGLRSPAPSATQTVYDTPRTDAEWACHPAPQEADFAKRLESENADLRHDIERLTASLTAEVNKAPSATAAPSVWACVYNGLVEKPCKVCDCEMKGYAPQAAPVEETAIGHARYEYLRTLNPREFAALYDEALHGTADNFDDLVDRRRMKGEPVKCGYDKSASLNAGTYACTCKACSYYSSLQPNPRHHDAGGKP